MILTGDWTRSISILGKWAGGSVRAVDMAIRDEAMAYKKAVVTSFRKQGSHLKWHPLSPITLALRRGGHGGGTSGGTKALIRTGGLRKSVNVKRKGYAEYFVGVHRSAGRASGGKASYVNVAQIHETGLVVIPITDKMRRYFRVLFWKGILPFPWPPKGKRYIIIRRRSFLRDTMNRFQRGHEARLMTRYASYLMGGKAKI